jgi:hypothetical protein
VHSGDWLPIISIRTSRSWSMTLPCPPTTDHLARAVEDFDMAIALDPKFETYMARGKLYHWFQDFGRRATPDRVKARHAFWVLRSGACNLVERFFNRGQALPLGRGNATAADQRRAYL